MEHPLKDLSSDKLLQPNHSQLLLSCNRDILMLQSPRLMILTLSATFMVVEMYHPSSVGGTLDVESKVVAINECVFSIDLCPSGNSIGAADKEELLEILVLSIAVLPIATTC